MKRALCHFSVDLLLTKKLQISFSQDLLVLIFKEIIN